MRAKSQRFKVEIIRLASKPMLPYRKTSTSAAISKALV
jgi:hypothetical protein